MKTTSVKVSGKLAARLWPAASTLLLIGLVVLMLAAGVIILRQRFTASGPYRVDYEGRIVDKSVTLSETQIGSGSVKRLHIRGKNGARFDVIVNDSLYDRAQVGMWIRSDRRGAELSWTEPPSNAGAETEGAEPPSVSAPR